MQQQQEKSTNQSSNIVDKSVQDVEPRLQKLKKGFQSIINKVHMPESLKNINNYQVVQRSKEITDKLYNKAIIAKDNYISPTVRRIETQARKVDYEKVELYGTLTILSLSLATSIVKLCLNMNVNQ